MKENGITEVDIAAALKIHPATVKRFLKGGSVQRSNEFRILEFVTSRSKQRQERPVAV